MPKDPFKPIQAERSNPAKQGFVRRAPIENIMWAPKNPKQLAEALATIVSELPPKALSWFWRELTTPEVKGSAIKEQVVGAVDQHFSMFPGGSAAFSPYYDMNDEDWEEDGVFPPHMRDFRNLMIKRPDLPMTAKTDGTGTLRRLDRLPQTTAELTMIAYDYGASVPQQLVAALWNRAQTLLGDALLQPEWVWQPEPIGNFHEAEQKNSGHPLVGDGSIAEEPVSELGSTTANADNFAAKGKITDTGKVMKENRKQRVQRLFNRVFEEMAASKVFEEDYMPYGDEEDVDLDVDYFGEREPEDSTSSKDYDEEILNILLGTSAPAKALQTTGRILGRTSSLVDELFQKELKTLKEEAIEEFFLLLHDKKIRSKDKNFAALAEKVLQDEKHLNHILRIWIDFLLISPSYLAIRKLSIDAAMDVLKKKGASETTLAGIKRKVEQGEIFSAYGNTEGALQKMFEKDPNIKDPFMAAKEVWRKMSNVPTKGVLQNALEKYRKRSDKNKIEIFNKVHQTLLEDFSLDDEIRKIKTRRRGGE